MRLASLLLSKKGMMNVTSDEMGRRGQILEIHKMSAIIGLFALAMCGRLWSCAPVTDGRVASAGMDAGTAISPDSAELEYDSGSTDDVIRNEESRRMAADKASIEEEVQDIDHILLLGFDRSSKLPGRTDSIMIAAARYKTGDMGVMSIPRDLWVDIPGADPGRINKVFRVGRMLHGKGGGRKLMKNVILDELGIRIDYTAAVDFSGFASVVDLLGGIKVDVACPIVDNFISQKAKAGYEHFSVNAGSRLMDGRTALLFSRSRHGRTDLDRARRQQAVLLGLKERIASIDVLLKLPSLWDELKKYIATDLEISAAARLAHLASCAEADKIHGLVLAEPIVYGWRTPDGKSVLRLNRERFDQARDALFDSPPPGAKTTGICRAPNVALNWKELARKRKERLKSKTSRTAGPRADAGLALTQ